jgi:hypothetical protein
MKLLDKNKTKELVDYASKLSLYGKITEQHAKDINEILNDMFTQQRTELLEEIKNMPIEVVGNSQATVNQIISLLNKKYE